METSSVMRFEDLLRLWQESRSDTSIFTLLGLSLPSEYRVVSAANAGLREVLCERLRGTWWEVIWPRFSARNVISAQVRCRYLADSLPDAIRLRPHADFPAHAAFSGLDEPLLDEAIEEPVEQNNPFRPL